MTEVNIAFDFSLCHRPLKEVFLQNPPTNPATQPFPAFLDAQMLPKQLATAQTYFNLFLHSCSSCTDLLFKEINKQAWGRNSHLPKVHYILGIVFSNHFLESLWILSPNYSFLNIIVQFC